MVPPPPPTRKEQTFITISRIANISWMNDGMKAALRSALLSDIEALCGVGTPAGSVQTEYRRCVDGATGQICLCKWELVLNPGTGDYEWSMVDEQCPA